MKTILYVAIVIIAIILFVLFMRYMNCKANNCTQPNCITQPCAPICKPCSFWTGKPIKMPVNNSQPPAPVNIKAGSKFKVTDPNGIQMGDLDATGCMQPQQPDVFVPQNTEIEILEIKTIPIEQCANPNPVIAVRISQGWFSWEGNKASLTTI